MSKMACFMTLLECEHVKGPQTVLKLARQELCHMCSSLWEYFSYKKSFLVISEILRPFFNLLTLDDKYCLGNRGNLRQAIQTQLSKKRHIFSLFFSCISEIYI